MKIRQSAFERGRRTYPPGTRAHAGKVRRSLIASLVLLGILGMITVSAMANSIWGSRHDLTSFNQRGYGTETGPMQGATYNNYQDPCVYCHTPHAGILPRPCGTVSFHPLLDIRCIPVQTSTLRSPILRMESPWLASPVMTGRWRWMR